MSFIRIMYGISIMGLLFVVIFLKILTGMIGPMIVWKSMFISVKKVLLTSYREWESGGINVVTGFVEKQLGLEKIISKVLL